MDTYTHIIQELINMGTKSDEFKEDLGANFLLTLQGRQGLSELRDTVSRLVDIYDGTVVPVDWDAVSRGARVVFDDGDETITGIFISLEVNTQFIKVLWDDETTVTRGRDTNITLLA